jgi:hypothetical protein
VKALTVRQPWALAIMLGKSPENRGTNIAGDYRGPLLIHSSAPKSKAADRAYIDEALASPYADWSSMRDQLALERPLHMGVVLGVVDLVSVHHDTDHGPDRCSPWAMPGDWHLMVEHPRPLRAPIHARGWLGLWTPDQDLVDAVLAQLVEASA